MAPVIELSEPQGLRIRQGMGDLKNYVQETLRGQLSSALGPHAGMPKRLTDFTAELAKLETAMQPGSAVSSTASIPEPLAPILAAVAAYYRRRFVADLEDRRVRALVGELLDNLDAAKAVMDDLLMAPWYHATAPLRLPRLSDFVATSRLDRPVFETPAARAVDDKFGILLSASELWGDLRKSREECEERSAPVAIAFLDVDGLKALNTQLGEPWVDSLIFPPLLRCIERTIFGKGYAYRYGGDEFALLLPSADQDVAVAVLRQLQQNIAGTSFERMSPPTISIGLCVLNPDSPLTDREALVWAARAKADAKTQRTKGHRNAIVVVRGAMWIDRRDVSIFRDPDPDPEPGA